MSTAYKRFLKLLEKWPLDTTKAGRDFGERIRENVKQAFNVSAFTLNDKECEEKYASLNRLADNHHYNSYKRLSTQTSTGLTAHECQLVLSTEFLDYLKESDNSVIKSISSDKEEKK